MRRAPHPPPPPRQPGQHGGESVPSRVSPMGWGPLRWQKAPSLSCQGHGVDISCCHRERNRIKMGALENWGSGLNLLDWNRAKSSRHEVYPLKHVPKPTLILHTSSAVNC